MTPVGNRWRLFSIHAPILSISASLFGDTEKNQHHMYNHNQELILYLCHGPKLAAQVAQQ